MGSVRDKEQTVLQIIFYQTDDGETKLQMNIMDESVQLTKDQMADLFKKTKSTINGHIKNIYEEKELKDPFIMRKFGNSEFSTKPPNYYNLGVSYQQLLKKWYQYLMKQEKVLSKGEIILYQTKDKKIQLEVKLEQETVWLTQKQIAHLLLFILIIS